MCKYLILLLMVKVRGSLVDLNTPPLYLIEKAGSGISERYIGSEASELAEQPYCAYHG